MRFPPRKVVPFDGELPLLDAGATRALERRAAEGLPPGELMRRAGLSVARLALALAPHAERFWIAAGPGNNGGDGLEAGLQLATRFGKRVEIVLLGDPAKMPPDAAAALARVRGAGVSIGSTPGPAEHPGLAIDALLGVGADRAPAGVLAEAIGRLHTLRCPVLAVDLPSGLAADTGEPLGGACVEADHTLALLSLKPGLVTGHGRDLAGTLWLDDLDADAVPHAVAVFGGVDPARAARRRHAQHKGSFGDAVVVGGATGTTGAALLAARAALAAGAGRTYVELLDRSLATARLDLVHPELMFRDDWTTAAAAAAALGRATVVCGCGGGEAVAAPLRTLLAGAPRLVIDADGLNAIAHDADLAARLRARRPAGRHTVLTPHPLEAARLLGIDTAGVQADRLAAAHALAERFDCVALVKGSGTVVAAPGQRPRINATGNAALATAGTGDVLAGWLGGRWAQHRDAGGDPLAVAFALTCQAVAEHGAAAEPPPPGALRASDLIERLHAA